MLAAIVGSVAAEKVLLYLQNYEQAHGREIAANFGISNSQVQKQLLKLESGGLLVSQLVGCTRLYRWNPRNPQVPPDATERNETAMRPGSSVPTRSGGARTRSRGIVWARGGH